MPSLPKVLICDDDSLFKSALSLALRGDYELHTCSNGDEALARLKSASFQLLLLDMEMRTKSEGLDYLPQFRTLDPELPILMLSGNTGFGVVRQAMKLGAWDYIPKDFNTDDLKLTLEQALGKSALLRQRNQQNTELAFVQKQHRLIGESAALNTLRKRLDKIRENAQDVSVVIHGETGTGKELVARNLRRRLPDGTWEPFVAIDSSLIQSTMAESLLFGHVKGAFTGADRDRKGLFEEADGGVIYFDEIANMPLEIQVKLLRVLQEKEVMRLGSSRPISLNFRVICATNRDLEGLVSEGLFKRDLFERLNVIPVDVPPLRERKEDIPLLCRHFLERAGMTAQAASFPSDLMSALQTYAWPGNVRELANTISYILTLSEGDQLSVEDLPPRILRAAGKATQGTPQSQIGLPMEGTLGERMEAFERSLLQAELQSTKGNISDMARKLGVDRSNLHKKLKTYGLRLNETDE